MKRLKNMPAEEILIIDKPKGWTSFDVVAKLRNGLKIKKIGHTGTLDPMATGVLVLLLGKATKKANEMNLLEKEYEAEITLGATSPTDDAEGDITQNKSAPKPALSDVKEALKDFEGEIEQVPPQFSAKKVKGRRAYAMARKGKEVTLEPVKVTVHELELLDYQWPLLRLRVHCGKGFYVRALARDIGKALKTGGYLSQLKRTKVGPYDISQAKTIDQALGASSL